MVYTRGRKGAIAVKKLKLYLETTVFNRYFEPEKKHHDETMMLFEEIAAGKFEVYTSIYVLEELSNTPDEAKRNDMLGLVTRYDVVILDRTDRAAALAEEYARLGVITKTHTLDRLHVACASVNHLDAVVSYNFEHINRLKVKKRLPHVNEIFGYPAVSIIVPLEVIGNDE